MKRERCHPGHTHDPWPCCGKDHGWPNGRPKLDICIECKRLIKGGMEAQAKDALDSQGLFAWHNRHNSHVFYGDWDLDWGVHDELRNAMNDLVLALSEWRKEWLLGGKPPHLIEVEGPPSYLDMHLRSMPTNVRDHLNRLDAAIRAALKSSSEKGLEKGSSIIRQLASGEMTLTDFDRKTER